MHAFLKVMFESMAIESLVLEKTTKTIHTI